MNTSNPILTQKQEIILPDNIKAELKIQVFKEPIWKTGDLVYNMATITRLDNKTTWGIGFYPNPFDEDELMDKMTELADNPQTIKSPFS